MVCALLWRVRGGVHDAAIDRPLDDHVRFCNGDDALVDRLRKAS
jgi:hypothetical protein